MGWADLILGKQNPFAQWANENSNFLGTVGGDLMSGGLDFTNIGQAKALDQQVRGKVAEKAKADALAKSQTDWTINFLRQKGRGDLADAVTAGILPVGDAYTQALKPADAGPKPIEVNGQLVDPNTFKVIGDYRTQGSAGGGQFGDTIIPLQGPNGSWVPGRAAPDGSISAAKLPDGTTYDPGVAAGARTSATVDAKTAGAARAALPAAEQALTITRNVIDRIRNTDQKGVDEWFGQMGALPRGMYVQGGSPMANFQVDMEQANGGAFLQARNVLKGAGPITDFEGRRAEGAYSRMQAAVEKGDKASFNAALDDFEQAVNDGYEKLKTAAAGGYSQGNSMDVPTAGGASKVLNGVTYTRDANGDWYAN